MSTDTKVPDNDVAVEASFVTEGRTCTKKGDLAEAIDTLFDRLERVLPTYVGKAEARNKSRRICAWIVLIVLPVVLFLKWRSDQTDSLLDSLSWIFLSFVTLVGVVVLYGELTERFYKLQEFSVNKNHYNLSRVWIPRYMESTTTPAPP